MMIEFSAIHPHATPDDFGLIIGFLSEDDPRPAKEQFNDNYAHGGGWCHNPKLQMLSNEHLYYPGDPPFQPIAMLTFRNERIVLYECSIIAIIQPDGSYEACRMD